MCGGTLRSECVASATMGLSPRVRGNPTAACGPPPCPRSIPACAGEPPAADRATASGRVYPRVCGGTGLASFIRDNQGGLSPRVRGNQIRRRPGHPVRGSIPACAGEPPAAYSRTAPPEVYPRVCGGTLRRPTVRHQLAGLSPRVRGNRCPTPARGTRGGSIPACAGEPARRAGPPPFRAVYPRVCGGTWCAPVRCRAAPGLSPRVRGNPNCEIAYLRYERSIPACAGEPSPADAPPRGAGVYPRVCGGTPLVSSMTARLIGLSPRVRGNLVQPGADFEQQGSIPACAGEPL